MVTVIASRPPMTAAQALSPDENASAERWRQWQQGNAKTNVADSRRMRFVFTALFVGVGMWLGIELLAPFLLR